MEPEKQPGGEKRDQIIAAAVRVFAEKGFHAARIEEIAVEAGVGKGTVYEYFASKLELFQKMLLFVYHRYLGMFDDAVAHPGGTTSTLQKLVADHLGFWQAHYEMAQVLLSEQVPLSGNLREWMLKRREEILGRLIGILERGIRAGEVRPVNTHLAAQTILGTLVSMGSQMVLSHPNSNLDTNQMAEDITNILMKGLGS